MDCCAHEGPGWGDARFDFQKVADGVWAAVASPAYKVNCNTAIIENAEAAVELVAEVIRSKPFEYWRQHLKTMKGQWAPFQSFIDLAADEQAITNDMIVEVEAADGGKPFKVVRGPVQFNHEPLTTTRAPQASEHTELVRVIDKAASSAGFPPRQPFR